MAISTGAFEVNDERGPYCTSGWSVQRSVFDESRRSGSSTPPLQRTWRYGLRLSLIGSKTEVIRLTRAMAVDPGREEKRRSWVCSRGHSNRANQL